MALNLVQHRGEPSIWDRTDSRFAWDFERWLISAAASALVASGMRRRTSTGLLLVLGGGALAWWAAADANERQRRRGRLRAVMPAAQATADTVGEASEASFPASDAPSWTPTTGNTVPCSDATPTSGGKRG